MDLNVLNIFRPEKQMVDDQSRLLLSIKEWDNILLFYFSHKMGEP